MLLNVQSTVDKLIKKTNLALVIGTHSWREQFVEAVTVSAGEHCVCVCVHALLDNIEYLPLKVLQCSFY